MFKRLALALSLTLAVALLPGLAAAQQGSLVTLAPTPAVAVTPYVTGTASDSGTVNKQLTVTITPPAGQYVYVVGWDASGCNDATGTTALTNGTFTTTGFTNLPKITQMSSAGTANTCAAPITMNFGSMPLKSATPGTAVTFVSPAANTHIAFTLNVYAYTAP